MEVDINRFNKMEYFRCGRSGLKLSVLSLGTWHNYGAEDNFELMKEMVWTAFNNGITNFDTADCYGLPAGASESNLGKIFKDMKSCRDDMVISTKFGFPCGNGPYNDFASRKHIMQSIDGSLKRLGVDYIDIYYQHRPDPDTDIEETMIALSDVVKSGKALYIGLSQYDKEQTEVAARILKSLNTPFIINQNCYNIFTRDIEQNGLKTYAQQQGKGIIAYCPLAQGLLTSRYLNGIPEGSRISKHTGFLDEQNLNKKIEQIRALNIIAQKRGQTLSQMALAWVLKDGIVTSAIIGASRPQQIIENLKVIGNIKFDKEELDEIDNICSNN